ncbi:MAG: SDR family oxidoreductase [Chloroflexia bacterium]|nr:SDR family oxidoreductase [Chloroflexia bacterium]
MRTMPEVVLITGASSGLGRAAARHLADRGYQVYGTSRRPPQELAGESFPLLQMDVTDEDSVRRAVAEVIERAGRIDVLLNNAGFGLAGAVEDTSIEEARRQFETNFFGLLRVTRAVLPSMRERRAGLIVNTSSIGGLIGVPFTSMYAATKFAIEGLSEVLRLELRPWGIRVVLVEPGDFSTAFTSRRVQTAASQGDSPYAGAFARSLAIIERDETQGSDPQLFARLIERIIRSRSPRLRYVVGSFDQRLAVLLKRLLPDKWFEAIIRGHYKV